MLLRAKKSWEIAERLATPESTYLNRRQWLRGAAAGTLALGAGALRSRPLRADADPSAGLYPVPRNERYTLDRPLTDEAEATTYNNYYEFGSSKSIWRDAQALPVRPWSVAIDGMVETPFEIGIDDLLAKMPLEERLYRHRCVEAWSMAVPWSGFPLAALVALARPQAGAQYLRLESFHDPEIAEGQQADWYPWPYIEGLTLAEATHDLAFMVTGIYGKPLPMQNGAPLRIALPWKYGFKSAKGLVRITFTDERPVSFWEDLQSSEYGFWANVNPEVSHPRWSQASERVLGSGEVVPTLLYNGYAAEIAGLYTGMEGEGDRLFR
jgi:sulfoxide reductase catalytic subunit YedY